MTNYDILKDLINVSVEKALREMGNPEYDLVISRLKKDYNCEIEDCLEHPEYLKKILCELFGNSYQDILKSIHGTIDRTSMEQPIVDFLSVMDNGS